MYSHVDVFPTSSRRRSAGLHRPEPLQGVRRRRRRLRAAAGPPGAALVRLGVRARDGEAVRDAAEGAQPALQVWHDQRVRSLCQVRAHQTAIIKYCVL